MNGNYVFDNSSCVKRTVLNDTGEIQKFNTSFTVIATEVDSLENIVDLDNKLIGFN